VNCDLKIQRKLEDLTVKKGIKVLYLLTTTAVDFFPLYGICD
jgi:N-acetylglutamate synthase-like GNAT family acetyltransferase